jgi:hypothetical protein
MRAETQASQKKKSAPVEKKKIEKSVPLSVTLERLRKNLQLKPR